MDQLSDLQQQLEEEKAIVDRVWRALGIETYEQAKPPAIDEHVAALKARVAKLEKILAPKAYDPNADPVLCPACDGAMDDHKPNCPAEVFQLQQVLARVAELEAKHD